MTNGISFRVYDRDTFIDDKLGNYFLPVNELIRTVDDENAKGDENQRPRYLKRVGVHKVVYLDGKESHGTLEFFAEFIPARMFGDTIEVPGVYFKKSEGNKIRLYMNSDDDGSSPEVKYGGLNDDEKIWKPPRLWRDIYDALCNAKHFIYIAGWSIDVDQYLLRGAELEEALNEGKSPRIGDLLKQKSEEGVIVNLMQWDDYTSNCVFPGMMGSHDEKTRNYFANTKVNSVFLHTVGDSDNSLMERHHKMVGFTHNVSLTLHRKKLHQFHAVLFLHYLMCDVFLLLTKLLVLLLSLLVLLKSKNSSLSMHPEVMERMDSASY